MTDLFRIAMASLWSRRNTALLTLLTIAISVALFVGVERVRQDARQAFVRSVSGIDLIVGARSHPVQLMLYSVFNLGEATANVSWPTYEAIANQRGVAWAVPISLGDSHRGFRVIGTTSDYFTRLRYSGDRQLAFNQGREFEDLFDAVLGAGVAQRLGYQLGDRIILAHGMSAALHEHDDRPFTVSGILAPTGTPMDQAIYVTLPAIEAIHLNWRSGTRIGATPDLDALPPEALRPRSITAFYLGLENRLAVFSLQRQINTWREEPLSAVLPGVALQQLWSLLGTVERALAMTAACVVLSGLLGLLAVLLATLDERRREMAILRAVGAAPRHVFGLLVCEAVGLAVTGTLVGYALLQAVLTTAASWLQARTGLLLLPGWPNAYEWRLMALVVGAAALASLWPAWLAYRKSVADGISPRT